MPRISVTFDPSTETQESIVDLLARIYGGVAQGQPAAATTPGNPISAIAAPTPNALAGDAADPADAGDGDSDSTVATTTRDKDGLPWDARVHSTPPTMTKAKLWRKKKDRDENVYASIKLAYANKDESAKTEAVDRPLEAAAPVAAQLPVQGVATPPGIPSLPPLTIPGAETAFQKLEAFLRANTFDPVANPNGRLNHEYIKTNLAAWGVPDGNILALQGQPDATIDGVKQAFAQALGVVA